jgi:DNA phosphorothioation-dependent restriction protein DptF
MPRKSRPDLIQSLYRAAASCADHHDAATVDKLHIETELDEFIRKRSKMGGIILLTGNPGDGKTHLLMRFEKELTVQGIEVFKDANEKSDRDLLAALEAGYRKKQGGVAIAINEGVLVSLIKEAGDAKWAQAAREILINPYVFGEQFQADIGKVCVIDLNLRNNAKLV